QSQPNASQNGMTKNAENQFVTSASQEANPEQQKAAASAVSNSSIQQNRVASATSDKNLHQPVFQYPVTDRVAKRDEVEKGSQNKDGMVGMISPKVDHPTLPERLGTLRTENRRHDSTPQIYSVVHEHVLGSCQGELTLDGKSISFVSVTNSRDEFKAN